MRRGNSLLAIAAVALAIPAAAQTVAKPVRVGVLTLSIAQDSPTFDAFRQAMRELGYAEGRNLTVDYRYAQGQPDKLAGMATELANGKVDVIVTESVQAAREASRATRTIPIVTAVHGDPVGAGLAKTLTRPEGNVTGLSLLAPELSAKRLQLLKEITPKATKVGALWNPGNPAAARYLKETQSAAQALGIELVPAEASAPSDLDKALRVLAAAKPGAFISLPDGMLLANRARIVEFAVRHALPAVYPDEEFADAGGLLAYGPSLAANFRGAAAYVDKIVKGAKPGDIPIEQPTRFDLVINLRTADALGIATPPAVVQRAHRVIK